MAVEVGIDAGRGDAIVCVWSRGPSPALERCLASVIDHTAAGIPILVCGAPVPPLLTQPAGETRLVRSVSGGFGAAVAAAAPADVVWLAADHVLAEGWLGRLRAAAYLSSGVASASALSNSGEQALVPVSAGLDATAAAAAVRSGSARLRPRLPGAAGHCAYIRRSALELVGPVNNLEDFSRRAVTRGMRHVLADDVLALAPDVVGDGAAEGLPASAASNGSRIAPLPRAVRTARRALGPLAVAVDARELRGPGDPATLHTAELIAALARISDVQVTAIVDPSLAADTRELFAGLDRLELVEDVTGLAQARPFDVAHRPLPVAGHEEFEALGRLGDRVVLTQPNLIAYGSPSYFPQEGWEEYRALTAGALAAADRVVFLSAHARDEALAEGLLDAARASVVRPGVDRPRARPGEVAPIPPPRAESMLADRQVMLVLGDDRQHRNRPFAIQVLAAMQRKHRWPGRLVFAGPHVAFGGTSQEEAALLEGDPRLREEVLDLGEVTESERQWLLAQARLVLHPSLQEEFSRVPFEAAEHDVPCLWAPATGLGELLPDRSAGIVPWDAEATAEKALLLVREEWARSDNVGAVRGAATALRWDTTAKLLVEVYRATCEQPPNPAAAVAAARRRPPAVFVPQTPPPAPEPAPEPEPDPVPAASPAPTRRLPPELEQTILGVVEHPRWGPLLMRGVAAGQRMADRWRQRAARRAR